MILMILLLNAIISIWQDSNADKALEALKKLQPLFCVVLREGVWKQINSKDLVPGDVVKVVVGNSVPADLRIAEI